MKIGLGLNLGGRAGKAVPVDPDAPVAVSDTFTVADGGSASGNILTNDSDPNGDSLTVLSATGITLGSDTTLAASGGGDVVVNLASNGAVTATPGSGFTDLALGESRAVSFSYTITDGTGRTDTASVRINVTGINDAVVAVNDAATVAADATTIIDVLANDSDPDTSDTLTITAVAGATGSVTNNSTSVTYDPNGQFDDVAEGATGIDTFTYTVSDGTTADTATVTVTVTGVNDAPVAVGDTAAVNADASVTISVVANDSDVDGDTLTPTVLVDPSGAATATVSGATIVYDPNGKYDALGSGTTDVDTFTYTVSDGNGGTDTATVSVTVTGVASGGGSVFDGALIILDASDAASITSSAGAVSQWDDQTTNNNDFTQATAADQPTTGTATLNSLNVISGSTGAQMFGPLGQGGTNDAHTVLFVTGARGNRDLFEIGTTGQGSRRGLEWLSNGTMVIEFNSGVSDFESSGALTTGNYNLWGYTFSGNGQKDGHSLYYNGTTEAVTGTDAISVDSSVDGMRVYFNGNHVGQVLFWDRVLTSAELAEVKTAMDLKWS